MDDASLELYWIPVAAGTSRAQQASLRFWEGFEAARARRRRAVLYHSALKFRLDGQRFTLELMPAFIRTDAPPLMTGPVGVRGADRLRLFRYQLVCLPVDALPDEQWAVESPVRLSADSGAVRRVIELAPCVPRYAWGRRQRGTREMWTSDSVVSWLLVKAGVDLSRVHPPRGGRAPGWDAGKQLAASN